MCNPTGGFLGALGLQRPALNAVDRPVLVGLEADDPIPEGAMLTTGPGRPPEGHVSSAGVAIGRRGGLALGLLADGAGRMGETLLARSPTRGRAVEVRVSSPHHYDPAGERYRD
jgi:sarcosine oxidase subunit alpha